MRESPEPPEPEALVDPLPVEPLARPFEASIRVPGSKSLTNRLLVLAALARGSSRLDGPLFADDTLRLAAALETLGCPIRMGEASIELDGGAGRLPRGGAIDLGDGGTPTRFMLALAPLAGGPVAIDGSARMRERPVEEGIALLRLLGARIETTPRAFAGRIGEGLPATVQPSAPLRGATLEIGRTASSQFLSALLLVGPTCAGPLELRYRDAPTSASYLDLTVDALRRFGVAVGEKRDPEGRILAHRIEPQPIAAARVAVEPDASSAAYPALAAALLPGSRVTLLGLERGSRQPDIRFIETLGAMGAEVRQLAEGLSVEGRGQLAAIDVDASLFPDAAMALAVACARAAGPSRIRGLATLRVKETDRLAALAAELNRVGATAAIEGDALRIEPIVGGGEAAVVHTYRDHRMAMSFAVLGLVQPGIAIADPRCVIKSYPRFWADLAILRR